MLHWTTYKKHQQKEECFRKSGPEGKYIRLKQTTERANVEAIQTKGTLMGGGMATNVREEVDAIQNKGAQRGAVRRQYKGRK